VQRGSEREGIYSYQAQNVVIVKTGVEDNKNINPAADEDRFMKLTQKMEVDEWNIFRLYPI